MQTQLKRKTFTVNEYHCMAETGLLKEDDRLELVDGEIIQTAAIGSRHAACVDRINRIFSKLLPDDVIIRIQSPVIIGMYSEPEPDIALLKFKPDFYAEKHPESGDVKLIVEVSDTSLDYDRDIKLPMYAKEGIREVWIVNLVDNCVEINSKPSQFGYELIRKLRRGNTILSKSLSDIKIAVDEIIGGNFRSD